MRRFRVVATAAVGAAILFATLLATLPASAAESISYTFRFENGQTVSGVADDKNFFLADAGGSSADNPTGMVVHLSCSDKFTGGWGDKEGPVQGVDTAWRISSYFIQKGSKTCGTPSPPPPPADPPAIDIEKYVNGQDADDPTGPEIQIGETATFSYVVTNTGGLPLRDIEVTDNELGPISCPRSELGVGQSMECDEHTEVVTEAGQFTMKATVIGIADVTTPGLPQPLPGDAKHAARFTFVNGVTVTRVSKDKDDFFPEVGGTSVDNPTGVKIHLSCSDRFIGGWGQKDGPTQGVDTAWQIASYSIGKVKKGQFELKCGEPFAVPSEQEVMDMDPVYFIVPPPDPKIDIEKYVNGDDADNPPGPTIEAGSTATFTYVVTNTGDVPLENIVVTDNVVGTITCPRTELGVGQSMDCGPTTMEAEPGQQTMEACVEGFNNGRRVDDCDPVYYYVPPPSVPKIDIEKYVNGRDADTPPGPTIDAGSTATFTYIVRNTGDVPLENVVVTDNVVGTITCPRTELGVGQSMVCDSTTMEAEPGQQTMEACVEGSNDGRRVDDCDPVYYYVPPPVSVPKIDIEKYVNGDDADYPPGPILDIGSTATFTYVVTNIGEVPLENIVVTDNVVGTITCPRTELGVGQSMNCGPTTMEVEEGRQFMKACVEGSNDGRRVDDCDPVYYKGSEKHAPAWIGDHVSYKDGGPAEGVVADLFVADELGHRIRYIESTRTDRYGDYGFHPKAGCYVVVFIAPDGYQFVGGGKYFEGQTCVGPGETDDTVDAVLMKKDYYSGP